MIALALVGCESVATLSPPVITPSESVVTVAAAAWDDEVDSPTRVEIAKGDDPWSETDPQESGATHTATILGLYSNQTWTARVVADNGEFSERVTFKTEGFPADFPQWQTTGEPGWEGYLFTSTIGLNAQSLVMDERGRVVWYQAAESPYVVLRSRERRDGKGVIYAETIDGDEAGTPIFRWAAWDGTIERELEVPDYTHDFVELADGTLVYLKNDIRSVDGFEGVVWGNSVAELSTDGVERILWSTWDEWQPGRDGEVQNNGYWTHSNAIDVSEDESRLTVGFRDLSIIIQLDRETGEKLWQLGGTQTNYLFRNPGDAPYLHHQFEWVGDQLLVFDNRASPDDSRAVAVAFDESTKTASLAWEWEHDPSLWCYVLGDIHRREDGSTLVVFTTSGVVDDLDADGKIRWELESRFRTAISYATEAATLPGMTRLR